MESWEGYNYYTTNPITWVELMNLSTAEFGVGYLPQGVRAVPKALDGSTQFLNATYVIKNAGEDEFDEGTTAGIIFGALTGIVIIYALIWFWLNRNTILHPLNSNGQDLLPLANGVGRHSIEAAERMPLQAGRLCEANVFRNEIFNFYYEPTNTEVELAEKTADDEVDVEDIEALTDLARKMYSYDLLLYGARHTRDYETQRHDIMAKSDEILGAIRDKVSNEWVNDSDARGRERWPKEGWDKVLALRDFLQDQLPLRRYPSQ